MDKKTISIQIVIFVVIVALWQMLPMLGLINKFALSPLSSSIASIPSLFDPNNFLIPGGLVPQIKITLTEIGVAFSLSVILGIGIGFLLGYFGILQEIYESLIYAIYAIPHIIIYPIIFLVPFIGLGEPSKIVYGLFVGFFPMTINSVLGFGEAKKRYHRLGFAMGASPIQSFSKLLLPGAAPALMSGLRLSLAFTMLGVIAGEIIASKGGLGWTIATLSDNFEPVPMYGTIIVVILITLAFLVTVTLAERRVFSYATKA